MGIGKYLFTKINFLKLIFLSLGIIHLVRTQNFPKN